MFRNKGTASKPALSEAEGGRKSRKMSQGFSPWGVVSLKFTHDLRQAGWARVA
jgi:hypothetical protein